MFNIGTQELLVILLVVLLLFGAKRIPEVSRSLGKGLADFRDAMSGVERELKGEAPVRRPEPLRLNAPAAKPAGGMAAGGAGVAGSGGASKTSAGPAGPGQRTVAPPGTGPVGDTEGAVGPSPESELTATPRPIPTSREEEQAMEAARRGGPERDLAG